MGYINDIGRELEDLLENMPEEDRPAVIKFCKDKILESYRNGQGMKSDISANAKRYDRAKKQTYRK